MMALAWQPLRGAADLVTTATGALATDDGLTTAVILSLFLDRRAEADDELPGDATALFARRGWIGDAFALAEGEPTTDRIGSRLWLLARAKQTDETLRLAEDYAAEALAWLTEAGLATDVTIAAEWIARGVLGLQVLITTPAGETSALGFGLRTL